MAGRLKAIKDGKTKVGATPGNDRRLWTFLNLHMGCEDCCLLLLVAISRVTSRHEDVEDIPLVRMLEDDVHSVVNWRTGLLVLGQQVGGGYMMALREVNEQGVTRVARQTKSRIDW